jgi:hypothetical protein
MPGKYYIYIPFDTGIETQLEDAARQWRENRLSYRLDNPDRKTPNLIIHGRERISGRIHESPDQYTLYVLAHCNRTVISNTNNIFGTGRETLSPSGLANRMIRDGLPGNITNLKMYACNSGVAAENARHSFGELLYHALLTRGYDSLRLSAYRTPLRAATVDPGTGHKRTETGNRPSAVRIQWP